MPSVEIILQILNFDLFPGYQYVVIILGAAPYQILDSVGKQLIYLQSFCTHITILFFIFSTVFTQLYETLSTSL